MNTVKDLKEKDFLHRNHISEQAWKESGLKWSELQAIGLDHEAHFGLLQNSAVLFASTIQTFESVHSVRWRVKDSEHLLEKIVRKRSKESTKYEAISVTNYFEVVTDLVGIRALHLYKDNCISIDRDIRTTWALNGKPVVYSRKGDGVPQEFTDQNKFEVLEHPACYRSVHYVLETAPMLRKVFTEVQVRTVFEEGWSEIDHDVRYKNCSNNRLVAGFLDLFNRLAGSADEMGGFVRNMAVNLEDSKQHQQNLEYTIAELKNELKMMEKKAATSQSERSKLSSLIELTTKLEGFNKYQHSFLFDPTPPQYPSFLNTISMLIPVQPTDAIVQHTKMRPSE